MKRVIWFVVALAALIGVVAIIGYFLPIAHEASRSADFNTSPETVFALISDLKSYPTWWPENDVKVEVVEAVPPVRVVTRIVGETAFGGTWTMAIVPTSTGSRLTITERGEIHNPIFRALAKFVFGYTSSMDSCLEAVRAKLSN